MTQKTAHTPGPWRFMPDGPDNWVMEDNGDVIPHAVCSNVSVADGILIAAAPELLEALETLLIQKPYKDGDGAAMFHAENMARAAIRKARGES